MITIDDQMMLQAEDVKIIRQGPKREQFTRSVSGLDGAVAVDLGARPVKVTQSGVMRAPGVTELKGLIKKVEQFIDGKSHVVTNGNEKLADVRLDHLKTDNVRPTGFGVVCNFEMQFTQLKG